MVLLLRYKCNKWIEKNKDQKTFSQKCTGRYNILNKITVSKNGFISEIRQEMTENKELWYFLRTDKLGNLINELFFL